MRNVFLLLTWIAAGLLFNSCDSKESIEDPSKSYFVKFYGGDGDQSGNDFVVLPDGSFVLFGTTRSTGKSSQWYLVKANTNGTVLWEKNFGGPNDEEAVDLELTSDGRLVAVGNSFKDPNNRDILLMTFTLDGAKIDSTLVGLRSSLLVETDEEASSVTLTNDGFIVAGSSSNTDLKPNAVANDSRDAIHLRFFNNLQQYPSSWGRAHGPGTFDAAIKVIQISPAQFYLFGYSNTNVPGQQSNNFNYWIFGLGANGVANTADLFAGSPNDNEVLSSVAVIPLQSGEGYFLSGITSNQSGTSDLYVAKLRKALTFSNADLQFAPKPLSVRLGSNVPSITSSFSSQRSGFFILANENGFNNNQNWVLTKLGNDGTSEWSFPIVFGGEGIDLCGTVQELSDGRLALLGTMRTGRPDAGEFKMTLIKVNSEGKLIN